MQTRPDSCVAACCAMLLHRHTRGGTGGIADIHDRVHREFQWPHPPTLRDGARIVAATFASMDSTEDVNFAVLEGFVGLTWCAVGVMCGPWAHDLYRNRTKLKSGHGRLSTDPNSPSRHVVVVNRWEPGRVFVFDPWFDMLDQPIVVNAAWLRRAWTGELAYFAAR